MMHAEQDETIIAQCTPRGSGAIALIRISGTDAVEITSAISILASGNKLSELPTHTIHYGWIITEQGERVDQVLFLLMRAPHTFTGQDTVEITCHNNQFLIASIIAQALLKGARIAQQGEFSKRAFLNGKIDLIQAEAINELIHASTQMTLRQSLAQLQGSFSQWLEQLEKKLIHCLALSDASFEFIDEEMEFGQQIKRNIDHIMHDIENIKKTFNQQQHIRQGIRIAFIGAVNAGKSSLFNALLGHNRAIVTDIAGTTRDVIEAGVYKGQNYWTLVDTAGLRVTNDSIEQQGIARSLIEAERADIIFLVFDGARMMSTHEFEVYQQLLQQYSRKIVIVQNKSDLPAVDQKIFASGPMLQVSEKFPHTIVLLEQIIETKITELFASIESPFLLNQRHYHILLQLEQKLLELDNFLQKEIAYEIVSYHLKNMLELLTELSGKTISEKGMDAIFREFCIGK